MARMCGTIFVLQSLNTKKNFVLPDLMFHWVPLNYWNSALNDLLVDSFSMLIFLYIALNICFWFHFFYVYFV